MGTRFMITPADQMSVDQTASWIWTLSKSYGWSEADSYHKSFRDNKISGILLPELTFEFFNFKLGIKNWCHVLEINRNIQKLFPNVSASASTPPSPDSDVTPELVQYVTPNELDSQCCSSHQGGTTMKESSVSSCSNDVMHTNEGIHNSGIMSNSSSFQNSTRSDSIGIDSRSNSGSVTTERIFDIFGMEEFTFRGKVFSRRKKLHFRKRTLFVKLQAYQMVPDKTQQILLIRKQFVEVGVDVDISMKNPQIYEVSFLNSKVAREMLWRSKEMTFKLENNWICRPNPTVPLKYKSLCPLLINSGRSLNGNVVGKLEEGEIVTVNQVKGNRGRVIRCMDNGETEIVGWISLKARDGSQLIKNLNHL